MNVVGPAVEIMELADAKRGNALHQTAQEFLQWRRLRIEVHEYEALPGFDADRNQTILSAIEVLHSLELRHSFERSIETVLPAVVWTLQNRRLTARRCHHRRGMMPAHVVEGAQRSIV